MGRYATLKKEFRFLEKIYEFEISSKQKYGPRYHIVWSNPNENIKILYDEQDELPISIFVYDSDSIGLDAVEYKNEFEQESGSPREQIHRAAEWLRSAIADKRIMV